MRKRIIDTTSQPTQTVPPGGWLDLESLASVEVTSEAADHPVEAALLETAAGGWRAGEPGEQTIRLVFDTPLSLSHIQLLFEEHDRNRTQEYVLRWSGAGGGGGHEIVRQQYNFSPGGENRELEDYHVGLDAVAVLELSIVPNISGGEDVATLSRLRVA